MYDIIIQNGTIIDGTGAKMFTGDIGIRDGFICSVGYLRGESARQVIDAGGCFVTPGFIDISNHSDTYWQIFANDGLESLVQQGITTIIGGNSGSSLAPFVSHTTLETIQKWVDIRGLNLNWLSMAEFLSEVEHRHLPINFGTLVGHTTLRRGVLHDVMRPLEPEEIVLMQRMLRQALREGALGLSLGLPYAHAREASQAELMALLGVVKQYQGLCSIHLRDEGERLIQSIEEAILLTQSSGVRLHISHLKVLGQAHWALLEKALHLLEKAHTSGADISFDVYPYHSTASVLYTLLPEWVTQGGKKAMLDRLKDPHIRRDVIRELRDKHIEYDKATLLLSSLNSLTTSLSVAQMAEAQKKTPEEVLLNILMAGNGRAIISLATISEANIKTEMAHSLSIVSSNGVGYAKDHAKTGEMTHPRNFGAMPRFLGTFVREQHVLRWEEAIHKLTGAPAQRLGLMDRGHIMRGQRADVVIFHPEEIESMATFARPYRFPRGIRSVIVNGELTVSEGVSTEARAGQVIRRHQSWWSRILQSRIV